MDEVVSYIELLINGSKQKKVLLTKLLELTKEQSMLVKKEDFTLKDFNSTIKKKDTYLKKIETLDSGFNSIYNRIRQEVKKNKETYKTQLNELKEIIGSIADIGIQIQVEEEKNRALLESQLSRHKKKVKHFKESKKIAASYYMNMKNTHKNQSYFLDRKK